jgi:hypothetical protein
VSVFDVADEVAAILEPTAGNRDDARVRPFEFVPGKTYLWPVAEQYVSDDTGASADELRFRLRAAFTVDDEQNEASLTPSRTVSQSIQNKARTFRDNVVAARIRPGGGTTWYWLAVDAVDYDSLSSTHGRGFYMDLTGKSIVQ